MAVLRLISALTAAVLLATPALAQTPELIPPPAWAQRSDPVPVTVASANGLPVQILDLDQQIRFDDAGTHVHLRSRTLIRTIQGLASAGTVVAAWKPGSQTLSIHALNIVRGDQVIDVLASQSFEVLRREQRLESSILDGVLTATLQPADLRVGDVLEFAFTVSSLDPVVGVRAEFLTGGQFGAPVERFRLRASWPTDRNVRLRALAPWTLPVPRRTALGYEVEIVENSLQPLEIPANVPARFQQVRQLELSDHGSWDQISVLLAPLYDTASQLEPDSPLQAEIDRISQAWSTPSERASAALRLVQDDVRYLFLAMGPGGLLPASADETWRRRFGDCKGKTALLIALLRGLGIEAEAAAVSTNWGDGLNERLPMIGLFDHVLVRATIEGQVHWLDGTRTGDRSLETMPVVPYQWALPLRTDGTGLEAIVVPPAMRPTLGVTMTYDASGGLDAEARVSGELLLTGDAAGAMRTAMDNLTGERREEAFRSMWATVEDGFEIDEVDSDYDDANGEFRLTMRGHGRVLWTSLPGGGARRLLLLDSALTLPVPPARPAGPYADLPFPVNYPAYNLARIVVILPTGMEGFTIDGEDLEMSFGGHVLQRQTTIGDGMVVMTSSIRSLVQELSAEQTDEARILSESMEESFVSVVAPVDYRATEGDAAGLSSDTDDVDMLITRGEVLMSRREYAAAGVAYERAVELAPDDPYALTSRGRMFIYTGDFVRARADLDRSLALEPGNPFTMVSLGLLALQERRFDDAILEMTMALRIDGEDPTALASRGHAQQFLGRRDRALADYRAAIAMNPVHSPFKRAMIRVLFELGREDEARQEIAALLAVNPNDLAALGARTVMQIEARELDEAALTIETAMAAELKDRDKPEWFVFRAEVLARQGDVEGALADLQQSRELGAGDPFDTNRVCWTQSRLGLQVDRALADCEAAISASPGTLAFFEGRGLAMLQLDRPQEALAAFDAALVNGQTGTGLYGRGLALRALGRPDEASAEIAAALRLNPRAAHAFEHYEQNHPVPGTAE